MNAWLPAPNSGLCPAHPEIAASLMERGLTREETDKVCSANRLHVLRTVRS